MLMLVLLCTPRLPRDGCPGDRLVCASLSMYISVALVGLTDFFSSLSMYTSVAPIRRPPTS